MNSEPHWRRWINPADNAHLEEDVAVEAGLAGLEQGEGRTCALVEGEALELAQLEAAALDARG